MPVMRVMGPGNRVGYRWGSTGKIYTGPDAREKAAAQGRAAYRSGYRPNQEKNYDKTITSPWHAN